jgi:hypothetical protein
LNTITHIAATIASGWATIFAYQTLAEPALGGALMVVFFGYIVGTIGAIDDDLYVASGHKILKWRGDQREGLSNASKLAVVLTMFLFGVATAHNIWGS